MEKKALYTVEEVMELLSVSRRTVYTYISSGQLEAVKMGKYWRVKHEEIEKFLGTTL